MAPQEKATSYTAARNSKEGAKVATHLTIEAGTTINRSDPDVDTLALTEMASGFHSEFPDLHLTCDGIRFNADHMVYLWTLEGHHAETKNPCKVSGWEEWDLDEEMQITASLGWFDAEDYQRQIDGR